MDSDTPSLVSDSSLLSSPRVDPTSPPPAGQNARRERSDSIQRKRRSLNLVFPTVIPEPISSPAYGASYSIDDDDNSLSRSSSLSSNDFARSRHRWSQGDSVGRSNTATASALFLSAQDRRLQEKLQQLARSENAKLIDDWTLESKDSPQSHPAQSPPRASRHSAGWRIDENHLAGLRAMSLSPSAESNSTDARTRPQSRLEARLEARRQLEGLDTPSADSGAGAGAGDVVEDISTQSLMDSRIESAAITSTPRQSPIVSDRVRKSRKLHQRAQSSQSASPRPTKQLRRNPASPKSASRAAKTIKTTMGPGSLNGGLVINDDDINRLASTDVTTVAMGPSRPGHIGGTVLSWKMTSDIMRTIGSSLTHPSQLRELSKFLWAMFSRPENFYDSLDPTNFHLMPPAEVVTSVRQGLPKIPALAYGAVKLMGYMVTQFACSGTAFLVLFVQVVLISVMLVAYVIGDVLMAPLRPVKDMFFKPGPEPGTKSALKAAAKKKSKRRSKIKH